MRLRVVLILEPEQHEMAGVAGGESRHFEIVVHHAIRLGQRVVLAGEELLLIVVAGSPREDGADVERLAQDLTHHVFRQHAFGRVLVVRASGGVDVMVAGVPAQPGRIDPAFERERQLARIVRPHTETLRE